VHTNPDLLALLALGEDVAAEEDLVHISGCPDCQSELAAYTAAAGGARRAGEATLVAPRPEVWQQISRELQLHDPTAVAPAATSPAVPPPAVPPRGEDAPGSRGRVRLAAFVLAAALALAVGIGLGANLDRVGAGQREVASVPLNALPAWSGSSGRAVVEEDREGNRTLVVTVTTPQPATGPREVWMTTSNADPMIAMGYLQDGQGRFPIDPSIDLQRFQLVDISQEPAGDQDFRHSGKSMLRGKLPV
jgi:anti-sigma-K factor RskA